jgi:lysophospholipase L1-like esterase
MKPLVSLLLLCLVSLASLHAQKTDALQSGDLIAVCGDSITEQKLYSLYMADYFLLCQPAPDLQAMQFGWGGETAGAFLRRMSNDVLTFKPTVATTCYGMNDGGYRPSDAGIVSSYRKNMEAIVKTFKDGGVRFIVIGGPGAVDTTTFKRPGATPQVYNEALAALSKAAKDVAASNGVAFADVHGPMVDVMAKAKAKYGESYHLAGGDGLHPGNNGHLVMAYAFLKALGCKGDIGTFTVDWKSGEASALGGHKVLSSSAGVVEIESTQYPFCFNGDPASPAATTGILEFLPFNQDLNRLMLVVKNAPDKRFKVAWGTESREFSAKQLEAGINLAAEFLKNPFSEPFARAEVAMRQQQEFETGAIKGLVTSLPRWQVTLGGEEEVIRQLRENIAKLSIGFRKASRAAVVPVKHTLKIEAI